MRTPRILIVYSSKHGHTERIVRRIAATLEDSGAAVTLRAASVWRAGPEPAAFDAVVIGGSVRFGRHATALRRYVTRHLETLAGLPTAFLSVSGAAAGFAPHAKREADRYAATLLDTTGWRPRWIETFAGEVCYTRYNPLLRHVMKKISEKGGLEVDTSRDWDYTDWSAVEAFADRLVDELPVGHGARAARSAPEDPPRRQVAGSILPA